MLKSFSWTVMGLVLEKRQVETVCIIMLDIAITSLHADEIKLWLTPSAKQRRNSLSPLGVQNKDLCAASQRVLIRV